MNVTASDARKKAVHYTEFDWDYERWPNFSPEELQSKGDGLLYVDEGAMDSLQALRDDLGRPVIVFSAYRSPEHNRRVGGVVKSQHLLGRAFDVSTANHDPQELVDAAKRAGFKGVGWYKRMGFIHLDTGPRRSWGRPWKSGRFDSAEPRDTAPRGGSLVVGGGSLAVAAAADPERSVAVLERGVELVSGSPWLLVPLALIAAYYLIPRVRYAVNNWTGGAS